MTAVLSSSIVTLSLFATGGVFVHTGVTDESESFIVISLLARDEGTTDFVTTLRTPFL